MDPIVVVGSGASGAHFAHTLLKKGRAVTMLDVGHTPPQASYPDLSLDQLKRRLEDPVAYFLGRDYESLILPDSKEEYYGFPPTKSYVFRKIPSMDIRSPGFAPLLSFAAGGLAQAWTGGCYPFTPADLAMFPFTHQDLATYYDRVAEQIGISGTDDDMTRFFPVHGNLIEPLDLDRHSEVLLERYQRVRSKLNDRWKCYLGRSRSAVLSRDRPGRKRCEYLGRCLWGCPSDALYTPYITLQECRRHENFTYVDGLEVTHFRFDTSNRLRSVHARSITNGDSCEFPVGTLALAAGTLCSSKIFLESIFRDSGKQLELKGLMDNRQVMMPFINLRMLGVPCDAKSYQYHQVALGIDADDPAEQIHGLITTLSTALIHPIVQSIPAAIGTALRLFRSARAALGLVNINFADSRRPTNTVHLDVDKGARLVQLVVNYTPADDEPKRIDRGCATVRKVLRKLGCVVPSKLTRLRPMGASVHYCGTIPMTHKGSTLTTDALCRSRDFDNLYFVDGTTLPCLPAKNLTFTLMANACRVADQAF